MNYVHNHRTDLINRWKACKLPDKAIVNMVKRLEHFEQHHGIHFVVSYLKTMKSFLLGGQTTGLKTRNGNFLGDFRSVSVVFNKSRKGRTLAIRALNVYGLFEAKKPGEKEYLKFKSLIQKPSDPKLLSEIIVTPEDRYLAKMAIKEARFSSTYPLGNTRAPLATFKTKVEREIGPEEHLQTLFMFPNIVSQHYDFIIELLPLRVQYHYDAECEYTKVDSVGNVIGLTKDRGMKIRFIANPFRTIQLILSRLKSCAENFLKDLPESCVFDQDKGMEWVRKELSLGIKISSVDLTQCTDRLPLVFQVQLLKDLFPELQEDIEIFEKVSRSLWHTQYCDVKWKVGQPLGTGPSFSTFTIFHIFLIRSLGGNASNFRVIGDDVVFSNSPLKDSYLKTLDSLGMEISIQKSLMDQPVAEFAGRIIDQFGTLEVYKASATDFVNDPLGIIRQYGERGARFCVPKHMQNLLINVSSLPIFGNGKIQRKDLDQIDATAFYEVYSEKLEKIPNKEIAKSPERPQSHSASLSREGTTSGIPRQFLFKTGSPGNPKGFLLKTSKEYLWQYQDDLTYTRGYYGLGKWKVPRIDKPVLIDHINANVSSPKDDVPESIVSLHGKFVGPTVSTMEPAPKSPIHFVRKLYKKLFQS